MAKILAKRVVLQVTAPRELETGPIASEQLFATMHGIYKKIPLLQRLRGCTQDSVSFEIANVGRAIRFFVSFPEKLRNFVEGQVYAQYPDAEIVEVKDYAAIDGEKNLRNALVADLKFKEADIYPIKRYTQFEDKLTRVAIDPLSGITSTLAKFDNISDEAWIQIVVRPLSDKWRIVLVKCVKIIDRGLFMGIETLQRAYARAFITRKIWPKIVFFPFYLILWIRGFFVKAGWKVNDFADVSDYQEEVMQQTASRSHEKETEMDSCMDKVVKLLFDTNIRIVYLPKKLDKEKAIIKVREIAGSFQQFAQPHLNGFQITDVKFGVLAAKKFADRAIENPFIMNNEELATIFHLPNLTVKTPNISWVKSRKLEPPMDLPVEGDDAFTLLGCTNFRGGKTTFGIKDADRRRHVYIIGKTGMGKSTLLENMIRSDIESGKGVGVVDPHGDLADRVLDFVPAKRTNDVVLIDPADRDYPVAFNMLENVDPAYKTIVCSGLIGIFKKLYAESWGPRLEHILRNTILSLLESDGMTMLGITRVLQDADFRKKVVAKVKDPIVKAFWISEFEKMKDSMRVEAISPILNKVGQFLSSPIIRNIVGQPKSAIDLRFAMDKGKIVIVNLSKGRIGEDNSSLLGSMIITKFQLDAMSRADILEKDRKDFYLYVDEFQNFATDSFATILSEARKYKLNLTMANQYIAQMPEEVRDAVFGNVGSIISMQVGFDDAEYISQQFGEEVLPPDLVGMSKFTAYMRILIDNMPSKTFSMDTLPSPDIKHDTERREKIRKASRERYAKQREGVEDKILRWSKIE